MLAVWEITLRCDLACRHCGSRAGHARPDELSTAECLDLVRQLAELGTREVAIIGGEAYLRDDWLLILRAIKERGRLPTMTTGGRALTAERARSAAEAGLFSASVSIDGDEQTHDRLRGVSGSYRSAFDALAHLRQAGVHVTVNTQINRLSMPHLSHVLDRMIEVGARSWMMQITVAMGRAADEPDVLLQPYDLLELFPLLSELPAAPVYSSHKSCSVTATLHSSRCEPTRSRSACASTARCDRRDETGASRPPRPSASMLPPT
jgi:MoaA/NifB/PqqE/SkfB family radical SAM enzyme